ncbi:lipase secretion chaperone [Aquabacterium lacunae]|nr:lipase secretion chaperone [Aquabacterium lacunae]
MSNIHIEQKKMPWGLLLAGTAVAVAGVTWMMWPDSGISSSSAEMPASATTTVNESTPSQALPDQTQREADMAADMANIQAAVNGERSLGTLFDIDAQGKLSISSRTKDAMVMILEPFPQGPSPKDWESLEGRINKDLPKAAAQHAMQLLRSMNQVNLAIEQLKKANPNAEAEGKTLELFAQLKTIRRQHFDTQTANALFAEEEGWADFLLRAQSIDPEGKLSEEERRSRLEKMIAGLPDGMRAKATEVLLPPQ